MPNFNLSDFALASIDWIGGHPLRFALLIAFVGLVLTQLYLAAIHTAARRVAERRHRDVQDLIRLEDAAMRREKARQLGAVVNLSDRRRNGAA